MSKTSEQIASETGVPESVILLLFGLTSSQRSALRGLLQQTRGYIAETKGEYLELATKANVASYTLDSVSIAMETAIGSLDKYLQTIPFADMVNADPAAQELVDVILNNLNVTIPSTGFLNFIGLGGFELFEGVNSYQGMKRKIRELNFRIRRAVTISDYANVAANSVDQNTQILNQYIAVLDEI